MPPASNRQWSVRPKVSPTGKFHRSEQPGRTAVANAASMSIARLGLLPFAAFTLRTMTATAQPVGIGIAFPATCLGVTRIDFGYPKNRHRRGDASAQANHTGESKPSGWTADDKEVHNVYAVLASVAFAVFPTWAGLMATVALLPRGEEMMFPLNLATVTITLVGHLIFGLVLGLAFLKAPRGRDKAIGLGHCYRNQRWSSGPFGSRRKSPVRS